MNSDREKKGLRGSVQTIKTESFRFTTEKSDVTEELEFIRTETFDRQGHTLEENSFIVWHPQSSTKTTFSYDTTDKLTEQSFSNLNGEPSGKIVYVYDVKGRLLEVSACLPHVELKYKRVFSYHSNGKKAQEQYFEYKEPSPLIFHYLIDELTYGYSVYGARQVKTLYDLEGRASELQFLRENGKLLSRAIFTRDAASRITKEAQYDAKDFPMGIPERVELTPDLASRRCELIYDKQGRNVENRMYVGNVFSSRSVHAYDARGEKIEDTSYEADGTVNTQYLYEREYDGEGNWTKELMVSWDKEKGEFEPSLVSRREITYFR